MANTLQWHDLSLKQINQFYDTSVQQNAIELIASWFPSDDSESKKRILYDFYYFILMFAKEINLEPIQTSIFFSIMKKTHEKCISSPYMKLDEDYALFQNLLLEHSIDRPHFSKKYFSLDQIAKITEYATNTYFRHYSMYKYTFTKQQKLTLNTIEVVNNQTEDNTEEKKEASSEETEKQKTEEEVEGEKSNPEGSVSILETDKEDKNVEGNKGTEVEDQKIEKNKAEEVTDANIVEKNSENITPENGTEENKEDNKEESGEDKEGEQNGEDEEKVEISPREKAIQDLKVLIENAISPKIQELKTTLTAMLSNSEDQLIKQIKKMDEAKKKAAKEATVTKKGEKEKDDKKKDKKGEKAKKK